MNLRSTNARTIQDTLFIKGYCELYLRICINLLSHTCPGRLFKLCPWLSEQLNDLICFQFSVTSRKKKIFVQNILTKKNIHSRETLKKKNSCGSKIPRPPPHNFSNGPSLSSYSFCQVSSPLLFFFFSYIFCNYCVANKIK